MAELLSVSRPTVSRLLAEARRIGLVQITVHDPADVVADEKPRRLAHALGLQRVWLEPFSGVTGGAGGNSLIVSPMLIEQAGAALRSARLDVGDVLLVSSGRTLYELSRATLPALPGTEIGPTVGGVAEPQAWHQTNEITRAIAERLSGRPHFLFAQAMPSVAMRASLARDADFPRVTRLWEIASAALVGVGAPPRTRSSISSSVPLNDDGLRAAVGDVCLNFYDPLGNEITFPGSGRMVRISPGQLSRIRCIIAVATGREKVLSIIAGALPGLFNRLVTDVRQRT